MDDDSALDREGVDKLLSFLTKDKFKACTKKVKTFVEKNPNASLSEAEKFLHILGRPDLGLCESLNLRKFKEDCEATEKEICEPLNTVKMAIDGIKKSKEFALVLGVTLQVVNFMKKENYSGFQIEDLEKLTNTKDKTNKHSLLFHIVRKVRQAEPSFQGFPSSLVRLLEQGARLKVEGSTCLEVLDRSLEHMDRSCR
jgi:hypothetical protein